MAEFKLIDALESFQALEVKIASVLMYAGLRVPQYRAMKLLDRFGRLTVSELAGRMNVTRATSSALVAELLRLDFTGKEENHQDRRSFYVSLTSLGQERIIVAENSLKVLEAGISRALSDEAIRALEELHSYLSPKSGNR